MKSSGFALSSIFTNLHPFLPNYWGVAPLVRRRSLLGFAALGATHRAFGPPARQLTQAKLSA
jgi:hypothetical protein